MTGTSPQRTRRLAAPTPREVAIVLVQLAALAAIGILLTGGTVAAALRRGSGRT